MYVYNACVYIYIMYVCMCIRVYAVIDNFNGYQSLNEGSVRYSYVSQIG
jgi:hypothetical protein